MTRTIKYWLGNTGGAMTVLREPVRLEMFNKTQIPFWLIINITDDKYITIDVSKAKVFGQKDWNVKVVEE